MDLPTSHRIPITWLAEHACGPIKCRAARDVMPEDWASEADHAELAEEVNAYRPVAQITKKQKPDGVWGGKMCEPGTTIDQYRRLIEMGVDWEARPIQLANRVFYRLLSRDPDPALFFEFKKEAKKDAEYGEWVRSLFREAAGAALVEGMQNRDPRVRGAAQHIIDGVSDFLRGEHAEDPFTTVGGKRFLKPDVHPPTLYSVAMIARMPTLQRERAGFVERLGEFVTRPHATRSYWIKAGSQIFKSQAFVLGDPMVLDKSGRPKDIPFALYWLELLAGLGALHNSENACRALNRLLSDCNDEGVWSPRTLRSVPTSPSGFSDHAYPLESDTKSSERRRTDTTFRLALIAKLAGMQLDFA